MVEDEGKKELEEETAASDGVGDVREEVCC